MADPPISSRVELLVTDSAVPQQFHHYDRPPIVITTLETEQCKQTWTVKTDTLSEV